MENIRKNPALMGILSALGCAVLLLIVEFILSLINNKSYGEQLSNPVAIIILVVGSIGSGISTFLKVKKNVEEAEKKDR